ncbi:STAS domain-containing protein [Pseudonocardia nematodicida]|uniref:STAS domain-containing protein n=1 Tax=Pseudonocardia nematodicida TaxID=1206997 RepID=A0ABV1KAZ1_9PSEU
MPEDERPAPAYETRDTALGPALRFERSRHPSGAMVVHAIGAVDDETSPDLWVELGMWSEDHRDLVLDLSGVDFLGTAGLTSLLEARDVIGAEGGRLRVMCGSSRAARRALQVTGAMEMFDVVDRVPENPGPSANTVFAVPDPDVRLDGRPRD